MAEGAEEIVVYTCVAGKYDNRLMDAVPAPGLRFVCFTDHPGHLTAPGWEVLPLASPTRLTSGHDANRYHKFFPHRVLPGTRWSVYIDGNIRYAGSWQALVGKVRADGAALGAFLHRDGHDLVTEVEVCKRYDKFDRRDVAVIDGQLADYAAAGIDLFTPIPTNNVLVRDHAAPGLANAMSLWWSHLFEYCKRDQISLLYALREAGAAWTLLDRRAEGDGGIDTGLVTTVWHKPPLKTRIVRKIRRKLGLLA